jgi:hypothetical protein
MLTFSGAAAWVVTRIVQLVLVGVNGTQASPFNGPALHSGRCSPPGTRSRRISGSSSSRSRTSSSR